MNRKVIRVTIRINGQEQICTSENEYNQLQSTGLRVLCNIINGNGAVSPTANIKLYGLALNTMLKLMRIQWNTLSAVLNTVLIEAGEEGGTLGLFLSWRLGRHRTQCFHIRTADRCE